MRRAFARAVRAREAGDSSPPHVLVTMGGADPAGATGLAIEALARVDRPLRVTVLLGAAHADPDGVAARLTGLLPDARLLCGCDDMPALLADADLAVIAFGMTAYEAAAVGTPTLALSLTEDHAASAGTLAEAGVLVSAGLIVECDAPALADAIGTLLDDPEGLRRMGRTARKLIDGRGADRIAERIVACLAMREARTREAA
ncbi:MAG: glycosyltransferase [Alphaproteobacteria bacterium]